MGEIEAGIYNELKRNKFSGIAKLNEEDVNQVWESVSRYIERQMLSQKGVMITGLGSFTFSQRSIDVGSNKQIVVQRPVFQLLEKFAQTHALNYTKHYVTGQIPIITLNFTAIASETPYSRETVETCVKEVLQALSRSLHVKRNVEFIFSGIGCLSIRDSRVKMRFFKEFVTSVDNSGELVNALRNRPDTTDSVLSNMVTPRPTTGNTVILPRVNLSPDRAALDNGNAAEFTSDKLNSPNIKNLKTMARIDEVDENQRIRTPIIPSSPKPATPTLLSDRDKRVLQRPLSSSRANRLHQLPLQTPPRTASGLRPSHPSPVKKELRDLVSADGRITSPQVTTPSNHQAAKKVTLLITKPESGCQHNNAAGQELCYLCHQRSSKNIPIYLHKETKKKEYEEEQVLQQYQDKKDVEAILDQKANEFENRKLNQETAAFNLGVSEAIKDKKNARQTTFNRSYLFHNRTVTPPYYLKQALYSDELSQQVKEKDDLFHKGKSDRDFLERLEQVQLAEDLARQRDQYLQEKRSKKDTYCHELHAQQQIIHDHLRRSLLGRAVLCQMTLPRPNVISPFERVVVSKLPRKLLDRQKTVHLKPLPLPAAEPDSVGPIFGVFDATPEKMRDQREKARQLYHDQLNMVADKKRTAILRDLTAQREESEMLERTKKALLEERKEQFRDAVLMRQALERSWNETHRRKMQRESEESARANTPGVLIQEQCDKYNRCGQCGRRPWNCGESNIWRESRYVAGSRLIV